MMYAADKDITKRACETASDFLSKREETHFRSRKSETGRTQKTCEWSLGLALSKLKIPILPWLNENESPQLDFIDDYTKHDEEFETEECILNNDLFIYAFKAIRSKWFRNLLFSIFSLVPRKGDYMKVTPYCLHLGWHHQKTAAL